MEVVSAAKEVITSYLNTQNPDSQLTDKTLEQLNALSNVVPTVELLQTTQIGKLVAKLKKSANKELADKAGQLEQSWKEHISGAASQSSSSNSESSNNKKRKREESEDDPPTEKKIKTEKSSTNETKKPPTTSSQPKTADRITYTNTLAKALKQDCNDDNTTLAIATEIEEAVFATYGSVSKEYKEKIKTLYLNMSNKNNKYLRTKLLSREIDGPTLVSMPKEMLLSPEKQEELARLEEYARAKREVGKKEATSTMYTCAKCKNNKTTLTALQTRSADEPMTIFIECVVCGNKWRD